MAEDAERQTNADFTRHRRAHPAGAKFGNRTRKKVPSPATTRLARAERCLWGAAPISSPPEAVIFSGALWFSNLRSGEASSPGAKTFGSGKRQGRKTLPKQVPSH